MFIFISYTIKKYNKFFLTFPKHSGMNRSMLGKKRQKTVEPDKGPDPEKPVGRLPAPPVEPTGTQSPPPRPPKFRKHLKRLIIAMLVIVVLTGGGFAGYTFFLKKQAGRHYVEKALSHVTLPPEMMKFCFDNLPGLFDEFQRFSLGVTRLDREIQRLETIAATYPDQSAIADKEKKIWAGTRNQSLKNFEKLEKQVRQIYVTFQVNPETGRTMLDQERQALLQRATEILEPVLALTDQMPATAPPSDNGWVKKAIDTIKQLFT